MKKIIRLKENELIKMVKRIISEAIIQPFNFDEYLEKLKMEEGKIETIDDINRIFEGSSIHFSNFDEYLNSIKSLPFGITAILDDKILLL